MKGKAIIGVLGIALAVLGYNQTTTPETPNTNTVITVPDKEVFPVQPTDLQLQASVGKLDGIVTDKVDALILARVFRDWGDRLQRPTKIGSIADFQKAYMYSIQELVYKTDMEGKYKGKLAVALNEVFQSQLAFLFNDQKEVTSLAMSDEVTKKLQGAIYAISWKFSTIWEELLNAKPST